MKNNITIAITSCGRIRLLKKTILSLEKNFCLSKYKKIISEDTNNPKKITKIKKLNKNGFLKGWKILYTGGIGNTNEEKHYNALKKLYDNIDTKYVFHLEDDWKFKKINFDFIKVSENILEKNKNIGIIQLRDFKKDGGFNHINLTKKQRKKELFKDEVLVLEGQKFLEFRNDKDGDSCKGFSLNPGLRRTDEMKKIMFGYENKVDEEKVGMRMKNENLKSIKFFDGICYHLGNSFLSTKIIEKGFVNGLKTTIKGTYNYRIKGKFGNSLQKLYYKLDSFYLTRFLMDLTSWFYRLFKVKEIKKELLENIEGIKKMNISYSWFTEKKANGISGVARLKNADDFLEKVIESHINFLDEIILVDNLSKDKTKEICLKLEKKYPNKIKFFEYNYEVFPPGTEKNIKGNSIHSLAYFYNWSFSKSKYSHVMKVDDDNLLINEKWEKLTKKSKKSNNYNTYWGINLIKGKDNKIGFPKLYEYSGKYGDHGIYKVSKKTYYIQGKDFEIFVNNLFYIRNGLHFFHLKFLKKDFGFINLINSKYKKEYMKKIKNNIKTDFKEIIPKKDLQIININQYIKNEEFNL